MLATSYGLGELIRCALEAGCRKIVVGLGGTATVDGGAGMLQALGVRLLDGEGREVGPGGRELKRIQHLDVSGLDPRLKDTEVVAACDVDNPLHGPQGAAAIFWPPEGGYPADGGRAG